VSPPGGPSTHYGILYQILSELRHAFGVQFTGKSGNPDAVTLVIEPLGGGGDLLETSDRSIDVYQYKARADEGPWSLNEVTDTVFPDLLRAAVSDDPAIQSTYWFVTEGREGRLGELWRLKAELAGRPIPEAPLDALDDAPRPFFPSEVLTPRALFQRIAERAFGSAPVTDDEMDRRMRRIWRLIANFEIRTEPFADAREEVHRILRGFVDANEDVPHVADELYGYLLQLGARGHERITATRLLQRAGLPVTSLSVLATIPDAHVRLGRVLKQLGYSATTLIRREVLWPNTAFIVAVSGESGQGKTTLLAQLATETAGPAVFVTGQKTAEGVLQAAADEVWKRILLHDRSIDFESLVHRAHELRIAVDPWLTVFVDATATEDDLRELLRLPWEEWRVRLAVSVTKRTAEAIAKRRAWNERIGIIPVSDFTPRQVRAYLGLRGLEANTVRGDVLDTLRRPIVADVYAGLRTSANWQPENEYTLYDEFWRQIDTAPGRGQHNDTARLLLLTDTFLDNATYPWSPTDVASRLDDAAWSGLEKAGWLARSPEGDVLFRHERFLNWAVAKAMVERVRTKKWPVDRFIEAIADAYQSTREPGKQKLGYVAMDVLWLGPIAGVSPATMVALLQQLEEIDHQVYQSVVTLGVGIIPTIVARLRQIPEPHAWKAYRAVEAIEAIDAHRPIPQAMIQDMLSDPSPWLQDLALRLLRRHPDATLLDRIWELRRSRTFSDDDAVDEHRYLELITDALTESARDRPSWIEPVITNTSDARDLATLLTLVAALGNETGGALWQRVKAHCLAVDSDEHLIAVTRCIERYRDIAEIPRLEGWLITGTNWLPGAVLEALAYLAPSRAVEILATEPLDRVDWNLSHILRPLVLQQPEATRKALCVSIANERMHRRRLEFSLGGAYQLDTDMIDAVLEKLLAVIAKDPDGELPYRDADAFAAETYFAILDTVASMEGLAHLHSLADSESGQALQRYAIGRIRSSTGLPDFFLDHAHSVLLKIGGQPLGAFLTARLYHLTEWPRSAIRSVVAAPTTEALARVHELLAGARRNRAATKDEQFWLRQACIEVIAAVNGREAALTALEDSDGAVTETIADILANAPPVADDVFEKIAGKLATKEDRRRTLALLALTGRPEGVARIIDTIADDGGTSELLETAAFALAELVTKETPVEEVLRLGFTTFDELTLRALMAVGSPTAIDHVVAHLRTRSPDVRSYSIYLAAYLVNTSGRAELAPIVWRAVRTSPRMLLDEQLFRVVGHLADDEVEDLLVTRAFGADDTVASEDAIRGLAIRQPAIAFVATHRAVTCHTNAKRAPFVDLLFELDPARALETMRDHIPSERNVLVRQHIGRGFRQYEDGAARAAITPLLDSPNPRERAAGCELAGWIDGFECDRLIGIAISDADPMVRSFAAGAAFFQRDRNRLREMLDALKMATGSQAWNLGQLLIATGNPLVILSNRDSLWIGAALDNKPRVLTAYLNQRASERRKKHIEDTDKDMRDSFYR
jgi:hypothetical protein